MDCFYYKSIIAFDLMIVSIADRLGLTPVSVLISLGLHALLVILLTSGLTSRPSQDKEQGSERVSAFDVVFEELLEPVLEKSKELIEASATGEVQNVSATARNSLAVADPIEMRSPEAKKISNPKVHSSEAPREKAAEKASTVLSGSQPSVVTDSARVAGNIGLSAWINRHKFYPSDARRRGEEGTVLVRINVNQTGELESFQVLKSSGSRALDRAAAEIIKRSAPYPDEFSQLSLSAEIPLTFTLQS